MLGMMEEFGNDLADNLLKHDNKGMNYAEGMVYDQFRKILPRVKDAQNMFTYLASNSNKTRIPRSPEQNIIGRGKVELDGGIEIKVTFIQKRVQVERIVDGVKKQLPTERTFTRCDNCSYYSHIEAHFKKHKCTKWKKDTVVSVYCTKGCGRVFNNTYNRDAHVKGCNGEKPRQCGTCMRTFTTKEKLVAHMKKCEKKKPVDVFDCKYCNSSYLTQDSLNSHLEICPAPRPCRICNSTFVGKKSLEDHFTICIQKLKCSICLKYFATEEQVKDHVASNHKEDPTFDCQSCQNKYSSKIDLMDHMAYKHQNLFLHKD